jgi:ribosomal protein S18 acetylase RimI-like enzyme
LIEVTEIDPKQLKEYVTIPMRILVDSQFHVEIRDRGLGGLALIEEPVSQPWVKDYYEGEPRGVAKWLEMFNTNHWGFFLAHSGRELVGGATIASKSDGVSMLDGRSDLAVLWDIRVMPEWERQGVGTALFRRAVEWSRTQGLTQLKIETQNTNVGACRFYAELGCELRGIVHHAYAAGQGRWVDEVELHWWLDL